MPPIPKSKLVLIGYCGRRRRCCSSTGVDALQSNVKKCRHDMMTWPLDANSKSVVLLLRSRGGGMSFNERMVQLESI